MGKLFSPIILYSMCLFFFYLVEPYKKLPQLPPTRSLFQFFGYSSHSLPGLRRAAVPLRGGAAPGNPATAPGLPVPLSIALPNLDSTTHKASRTQWRTGTAAQAPTQFQIIDTQAQGHKPTTQDHNRQDRDNTQAHYIKPSYKPHASPINAE